MHYSHLYQIPGYLQLMSDLKNEQAFSVATISPLKTLAYEGASALFYSLVDDVKDAVLNHPLRLAISFGKDSTLLLAVFVEAYRQLIANGHKPFAPLLVTHADTRIESPVMSAYAKRQIKQLRAYLTHWDIPHEIHTAQPADRYSWPVLFIGGLKLLTVGASATADCSIELKQRPLQSLESKLIKRYGSKIVTVTGVRMDESSERKKTITELGLNTAQIIKYEKNGIISYDYAPLANIQTDEIWMMLRCLGEGAKRDYGDSLPFWDFSTWYLSKLYADQTDSCPIVGTGALSTAKSGGCSSSLRSGCSLCTTVSVDKQSQVLSDLAQYPQLKNLLAIRNWLSHSYFDLQYRRYIGRKPNADGFLKLEANTFNEQWLTQVLRWVLQADADEQIRAEEFRYAIRTEHWLSNASIQAVLNEPIPSWQKAEWISQLLEDLQEPTFQLVTPAQLLLIDALWSRDGYQLPAFSALNIWDQVFHQQVRVAYPRVTGKKPTNSLPAPRYVFVGDHPEFQALVDTENSHWFTRYIAGLEHMEFLTEKCGMQSTPMMGSSDVITYGQESGKSFLGWFGAYTTSPMINDKLDSDDSGYVIDEEAAEAITSFMIDDYLKKYRENKADQERGLEFRANVALRRLISEGVLRLSPMAARNSAKLMARARLYEEAGLLMLSENNALLLSKTISVEAYKSLCESRPVSLTVLAAPITTMQQLNDIKMAAKTARALYKRLCHSRCKAMITVHEMGKDFIFDNCHYYSLMAHQTKQMQEISSTLSTVAGILSLLPKSAPLRQHATLPMNVERILRDFAKKMQQEFNDVELSCWRDAAEALDREKTSANHQTNVVFLDGGMAFIKSKMTAIEYVAYQLKIRSFRMAS